VVVCVVLCGGLWCCFVLFCVVVCGVVLWLQGRFDLLICKAPQMQIHTLTRPSRVVPQSPFSVSFGGDFEFRSWQPYRAQQVGATKLWAGSNLPLNVQQIHHGSLAHCQESNYLAHTHAHTPSISLRSTLLRKSYFLTEYLRH
jgi:hypothetical protein